MFHLKSQGRPAGSLLDARPTSDPGRWVDLGAGLVIGFSVLQLLMFSFGRDQGIYAVVGSGLLEGKMPYRDLWDFKPPGIFFIYALAEALFGKAMWSIRILEVIGLLGTIFAFREFSRSVFGEPRAGLIAGALAALTHAQLEFWHTAQPESFGGFLTVIGLVFCVREDLSRRRVYHWLIVGALFGAAFLCKPPLGGGALVCAAYLARREWLQGSNRWESLKPVFVVGAASLVPIALTALWFWYRGAWGALAWTLFEFTPGYTALSWEGRSTASMLWWGFTQCFFRYSALIPVGIFCALLMRPIHSREREGVLLLLGVSLMHITGIAMQGKFFPYHYGATFPLLALIAGVGYLKVWRVCRAGGFGGMIAFGSFAYLIATMQTATVDLTESFWRRSQTRLTALVEGRWPQSPNALQPLYEVADYNLVADIEVAQFIQKHTKPKDWILVWGFEPVVYWLSDRQPATKYIYNVPQRSSWDQTRAREDLLRELAQTPPRVIVVQRRDIFPAVTGDLQDSQASLSGFPAFKQILSGYQLARTIEDFQIYVLPAEGTAGPSSAEPAL